VVADRGVAVADGEIILDEIAGERALLDRLEGCCRSE
jgi:hypothetical protein